MWLQIAPSDEELKKLKAYVEQPDKSLADLSTPEQFLHVIGQVMRLLIACTWQPVRHTIGSIANSSIPYTNLLPLLAIFTWLLT